MISASIFETSFQEKYRWTLLFPFIGMVIFLSFEPRFLPDFHGRNILISSPFFKFGFLLIAALFSTIFVRSVPAPFHAFLLFLCNFDDPVHVFAGICFVSIKTFIPSKKETTFIKLTNCLFCFFYLVLIYFNFDFRELYWEPSIGISVALVAIVISCLLNFTKEKKPQAILAAFGLAIIFSITSTFILGLLQNLFLAVMSCTIFLLFARLLMSGKKSPLLYFLIFLVLSCGSDLILKQNYLAEDSCEEIVCFEKGKDDLSVIRLDNETINKISEQSHFSERAGTKLCATTFSQRISVANLLSYGDFLNALNLIILALEKEEKAVSVESDCLNNENLQLKKTMFSKVLQAYKERKASNQTKGKPIFQQWTSEELTFLSKDHLTHLFTACPQIMLCLDSIDALIIKLANQNPIEERYGDFYQLAYLLGYEKLISDKVAISLLKPAVQLGHEDAIASLANIILAKGIETRQDLLILRRLIDRTKTGPDLKLVAGNSLRLYFLNFGLFDFETTCKLTELKLQNIENINLLALKHQNWQHLKEKLKKQLNLAIKLCTFGKDKIV